MQQPLLERSTDLPPEPASAAAARRFVREALTAAGRDEWVERAELAASELVTNAILHAHTAIHLAVEVTAHDATVRVSDGSLRLPSQRHWGSSATTGRGLALVAALTVTYGVDVDADGKHVWFRLDETVSDGQLLAPEEWNLDDDLADIPPQHQRVRLVGVPVVLWLAAQQHQEAVLRELFLGAHLSEGLDLPAASHALGMLSQAVDRGVVAAIAAGGPLVTLPTGHPSPLPAVPPTVDADVAITTDDHATFSALQDALDAGVRLGAADKMLIRPALPETVALRDWACEQVLAQANGVPPSAWSGAEHPRFVDPESARNTAPAPRWDDTVVRTTPRAVVAADDNNRIVAVSAAAAEMLGWEATELTGRRVVTIVPERLREAHVAGFTRHLTTGEAHVLGVPVDLPVLRRDGTEILCRFIIDKAAVEVGRSVYLAWLTPLS